MAPSLSWASMPLSGLSIVYGIESHLIFVMCYTPQKSSLEKQRNILEYKLPYLVICLIYLVFVWRTWFLFGIGMLLHLEFVMVHLIFSSLKICADFCGGDYYHVWSTVF